MCRPPRLIKCQRDDDSLHIYVECIRHLPASMQQRYKGGMGKEGRQSYTATAASISSQHSTLQGGISFMTRSVPARFRSTTTLYSRSSTSGEGSDTLRHYSTLEKGG
ncbi:hypothetical protein KQX54_007383 [Cotesia glomerata]|uniref:Uncharacterized protein n=1 Tax=Cotesia glomerata TaxID=32391 RepID=A0AAV7IQP6_COTGL|nr:hypothetical protein KQX54_007383 [Cotesia glomerata]